VSHERAVAFAPGRVNLLGEHTDYNEGLALPFAIAQGITVRARKGGEARIHAEALLYSEADDFPLTHPPRTTGWRAYVRGVAAELGAAGWPLTGAHLRIEGDLPPGAGLSSSAALEVAVCLALIELGGGSATDGTHGATHSTHTQPTARPSSHLELARLCARAERGWTGAQTGLLDQLACLYGAADHALCIDFQSLDIRPVAMKLGNWRLVVLDSGERHTHADTRAHTHSDAGYNQRREECAHACELLEVHSLREIEDDDRYDALALLPGVLRRRAEHVVGENERVRTAVTALSTGDLPLLGELLNASHRSLRDLYEVSTPAVERTVERLRAAGAAGARIVGGGFGGSVLGLFAPYARPPADAREVRPAGGAHLLAP
jgi:galactokinase